MGLKFAIGCRYKVVDPAKVRSMSGVEFENDTFTCHAVDQEGVYSKDGRFVFPLFGINEAWDDYPRPKLPLGWAVCPHELLDSGHVVLIQ